jgi:glycosyltransferase involved in cell wall biosynthesis
MIKLSAVIITLNEEKNIDRCIRSLLPVADEILVVDSFSTDETCNISRSLGAKVIQHAFSNYTDQKNFAVGQAQYDYILSVDADEVLSDVLAQEILHAKEDFAFDGYNFNRLNNYCGKWIRHSGWYPDRRIRLFDRRKGVWTGILIHEKIEMTMDSKTGFLKGDLLHYSYTSIRDHLDRAKKYSGINAESAVLKGRKSNRLKLVFVPFWRFIRHYIFQLGILDGYYGLVVCLIISYENFLKYAKMIELQKTKKAYLADLPERSGK